VGWWVTQLKCGDFEKIERLRTEKKMKRECEKVSSGEMFVKEDKGEKEDGHRRIR